MEIRQALPEEQRPRFDALMLELGAARRAVKDFDRLLAKHHIEHPAHEGCEPGLALAASGV